MPFRFVESLSSSQLWTLLSDAPPPKKRKTEEEKVEEEEWDDDFDVTQADLDDLEIQASQVGHMMSTL